MQQHKIQNFLHPIKNATHARLKTMICNGMGGGGWSSVNRNKNDRMIELVDKDFKLAIINMLKDFF